MYPTTLIKIEDNSQYQATVRSEIGSTVTAMQGFASERGTEDFVMLRGSAWYSMFGTDLDFKKYGQALQQAAKMIDAGATVYSKRVVAPDAKLSNVGIYAKVQKVAQPGDNFSVKISYHAVSVECQSNNMDRLSSLFEAACPSSPVDGSYVIFPLFVLGTQGRGTYAPRFRITPDFRYSRLSGIAKYLFETIDPRDTQNEEFYFTAYPDNKERNISTALDMQIEANSDKLRVIGYDDNFIEMLHYIENVVGLAENSLVVYDFLFGHDNRGNDLSKTVEITKTVGEGAEATTTTTTETFKIINIDTDSAGTINLQDPFGIALANGSNGSFGEKPLESEYYASELVSLFNGTYAEEIYNLDSLSIDLIVDANYPDRVKRAIEEFITFREDVFFMRDMGLDITGITDMEYKELNVLHNRYSSSYCNSMDVIDEVSGRYVNVTIMYLIAPLVINHFLNGRSRPFAGIRYGVYWLYGTNIKRGSINFVPKVTPTIDEKQQLEDLGVNYVSIYNGNRVVLETLYTSQHVNQHTQLSFSCNVWAIQEVIKALRARCPISRYALASGKDLEAYQTDLKNECSKYSSNFMSFDMQYQADPTYIAQKIYYAVLTVQFYDFFQTEYFKITVLPTA